MQTQLKTSLIPSWANSFTIKAALVGKLKMQSTGLIRPLKTTPLNYPGDAGKEAQGSLQPPMDNDSKPSPNSQIIVTHSQAVQVQEGQVLFLSSAPEFFVGNENNLLQSEYRAFLLFSSAAESCWEGQRRTWQ